MNPVEDKQMRINRLIAEREARLALLEEGEQNPIPLKFEQLVVRSEQALEGYYANSLGDLQGRACELQQNISTSFQGLDPLCSFSEKEAQLDHLRQKADSLKRHQAHSEQMVSEAVLLQQEKQKHLNELSGSVKKLTVLTLQRTPAIAHQPLIDGVNVFGAVAHDSITRMKQERHD